jgi:hypothetical protein
MLLAICGLMIRNRTCLWVGMIFSVESYLNQRASEGGLLGSPAATIMYGWSTTKKRDLEQVVVMLICS